jgi:glutamine amidotransferase
VAAAAPYASGRWLFSHNGALEGWPSATASLAATLPPADLLALEARCDSALVWALVARQLSAGAAPAGALAWMVAALEDDKIGGRFNFLLTNGEVIAATAAGNSLCYRLGDGAVVVASEPGDEDPGWTEVPDRTVLTATPAGVDLRPLPAPPTAAPAPATERTATL